MVRTDEREKCVFSVLSVRADVVVAPNMVESMVEEDVPVVAELTEELNVLSLTAGQPQSSCCVDAVGKVYALPCSCKLDFRFVDLLACFLVKSADMSTF